MLSVICFSKNRPLQLQAYVQSLMHYSGLPPETITVLYADSPDIRYDALIARHPAICWRRETTFLNDLRDIVSSSARHILFGCDDVFFTGHFDVNIALDRLVRDRRVFGFSLRLGVNLHSVPDLQSDGQVLCWDWTRAASGHWSYPWDVSASIYRREFVAEYLAATPQATNPNRLESILAKSLEFSPALVPSQLACLTASKCVTLTVNRVQDEFPNKFDDSRDTDLQTLYAAFECGRELDWPRFGGVANRSIHVDSTYFKLCDCVAPPVTLLETSPGGLVVNTDMRRLRLKVFMWKHLVRIKESARPYIPRRLMPLLRQLLRMR